MATYSFADVQASISGPGGSFNMGSGSGSAEEGITVAMTEDKNTMTIGADGAVMHSLHAGKSGMVMVRLLKTSPVNRQLTQLYNTQTASSALHGSNTVTVADPVRGDLVTCQQVAFAKHPDVVWQKEGNTNEWTFHAGVIDWSLGSGSPAVAQ